MTVVSFAPRYAPSFVRPASQATATSTPTPAPTPAPTPTPDVAAPTPVAPSMGEALTSLVVTALVIGGAAYVGSYYGARAATRR